MSRRPARISQAEIARALRAVAAHNSRGTGGRFAIEVSGDTIRLVPVDRASAPAYNADGFEARLQNAPWAK
jgi:hypothetical protein